jgi:uncharacterized membrane protein YfcA
LLDETGPPALIAAAVVAAAAGVVRGITGFGGAMVMTPPLALLLGPYVAVPAVLLIEGLVATPMLVQTRALVRWRVLGPILGTCILVLPVGTYLLLLADAVTLRRVIAAVVLVFSLLLLRGWRYAGEQRASTSAGVGAVAGALIGATGIGGPPVILYLLSGPDPVSVTRANLTFYVAVSCSAAFVALWVAGVLGSNALVLGLALAPLYYAGLLIGTRLFPRFDERRFRQFTLALLAAVSAGILLA